MKSVPKLIQRCIRILILSFVLLVLLNLGFFVWVFSKQNVNGRPWTTAGEAAEALEKSDDGYRLPEDMMHRMEEEHVWAVYIDDETGRVLWKTENVPAAVPMSYRASDIAALTRGYIDDYPTFTGQAENGLMVLGYPRESFWKHMWPSWDYQLLKICPKPCVCCWQSTWQLYFLSI